MDKKDLTGLVPEQYTGKEIIAEVFKEMDSPEEAKALYLRAKNKLLDVNNWEHTGSIAGTRFELMDSDGDMVKRSVEEYDYFRITLPGPGSQEGDGYDWVHVEELKEIEEEDIQSLAFRVRPTSNPESPRKETAHFYSEESTSTFTVTRQGNKVTARIVDNNIKPNNEASSFPDKLRDNIIALGGITGLSKLQWQTLAEGLLSDQ